MPAPSGNEAAWSTWLTVGCQASRLRYVPIEFNSVQMNKLCSFHKLRQLGISSAHLRHLVNFQNSHRFQAFSALAKSSLQLAGQDLDDGLEVRRRPFTLLKAAIQRSTSELRHATSPAQAGSRANFGEGSLISAARRLLFPDGPTSKCNDLVQ